MNLSVHIEHVLLVYFKLVYLILFNFLMNKGSVGPFLLRSNSKILILLTVL